MIQLRVFSGIGIRPRIPFGHALIDTGMKKLSLSLHTYQDVYNTKIGHINIGIFPRRENMDTSTMIET
jgi:hypothetical protein